ncbi:MULTISPECIES: HPP family protein [Aeromonas]|uniref:HPP family protein n=1 Tax=Aeromonas TaxID=642 RepID=UPI00186249B9|nr:HPP family protein [Aeromonas hydrophila]
MRRWYGPLWAGVGAALAIGVLGGLNISWHGALIMAPFGASCVLLFSLPTSPLARPWNVLGGHLLTAAVGLLVQTLPLPLVAQLALGVGLAITLMQGLNLIHPPAGANPLLVLMTGQQWPFLWHTVLPGALLLILLGYGFQRVKWRLGTG